MPGVTCVAPTAAFYAMPQIALPPGRTDEHYVKALLHATGVLCVYGSGFGLPAEEGFLRIVFLAPLDELTEIYDLMAAFTAQYLRDSEAIRSDRARSNLNPNRSDDFTRRMLQTVATVAGVAILLAVLWAARDALLLVYVSALHRDGAVAAGQAHRTAAPARHHAPRAALARDPRRSTRVLVAVVVFIGLLVIPPLVAQGSALWAKLPAEFNRFQTFLISHKLMTHRVTLEEAVQNAPSGTGGNAVGTVLVAISSLIGGIFGLITILILTFYLLIEAGAMFEYLVRFVPRGRRADLATAARAGRSPR